MRQSKDMDPPKNWMIASYKPHEIVNFFGCLYEVAARVHTTEAFKVADEMRLIKVTRFEC